VPFTASPKAQKVIMDGMVRATPIISYIGSYIYSNGMTDELVFHVVSDCGEKDTVIEYLARRITDDLLEAILEDELPLDDVVFIHCGPKDDPPPDNAHLIYMRDA